MSVDTVQQVRFVDGEAGVGEQTQPPVMTTEPPSYLTPDPQSGLQTQAMKGEKTLNYDQVFKLEGSTWSKFHDVWAAVLFIAVVLGFLAVSIFVGLHQNIGSGPRFFWEALPSLTSALAASLSLGPIYVLVVQKFPKSAIYLTGILHMTFCIVIGGWLLTLSNHDQYAASLGGFYLISAVVSALCLCVWTSRIPYNVIMLRTATEIARSHGHVFLTSVLGAAVTVVVTAWYTVTLACLSTGDLNKKTSVGLGIFVSFAFYWITEVIKNVVHVTVSGVYGSWYFCSGKPCGFPLHATRSAFKRAATYSFGSIGFGSLLITIVRFLQAIARSAAQSNGQQNAIQLLIVCVMRLLLRLLEYIIELINKYAFSYIALFGSSYINASKSIWRLFKDRGITLLVTECVIDPVLSMGAFFIGSVCFAVAYPTAATFMNRSDHDSYNQAKFFVGIWAFFIGSQIANIFLTPIKSGVITLFVAIAFEPEVLVQEHPELYGSIVKTYPSIASAVHA